MRFPVALFLCLSLGLTGCGKKQEAKPRPAALVEAAPIGSATFSDDVAAVGTALANEQVVLSAPVTQRITALNFSDGGFVKQGQVIATLAQGQEQAQLAAAQAQALEARQQLDRIKALKARGFATTATFDQQVAAANAALANAQLAKASIGDRVIRAPFSGWASLRTVSVGAIISAGTPIATVSDISRIKLDFTVPETQLSLIRQGQAIKAVSAAWPDRPFSGAIATIDPVVDPATRAVKVRAILPNPDRALKPGMLMTVSVIARQHRSLAVPELAVVGDGEQRSIFIVQDGKVKRTDVRTGLRQNGLVEILDGVKAGQVVVTDGVVKLTDGVPVRMEGAKAPTAAPAR